MYVYLGGKDELDCFLRFFYFRELGFYWGVRSYLNYWNVGFRDEGKIFVVSNFCSIVFLVLF